MEIQETGESFGGICGEYTLALLKIITRDGYYKGNVINFVPELMDIGEDTVRLLLNDEYLKAKWADNNVFYYNVVFQLSFRAGVLLAEKWHTDFDNMNMDYVVERMSTDFMEYTTVLMQNVLGLQENVANRDPLKLLDELFDCWIRKVDPDFYLDNRSENYMVASILAVYAIAVSMMLEKIGVYTMRRKDYDKH